MNVETLLQSTVQAVVPETAAGHYLGTATEYCVTRITRIPEFHGDDEPELIRCLVYVHHFAALNVNVTATDKRLMRGLADAGFTMPTTEDATDDECRHTIFECEYAERVPEDDNGDP